MGMHGAADVAFVPATLAAATPTGVGSRSWLGGTPPHLRTTHGTTITRRAHQRAAAGALPPTATAAAPPARGVALGTAADPDDGGSNGTALASLQAILPHSVLRRISKPARYLGNEAGAVHGDWNAAAVRFVLAYPEVYEVGMSNSGHVILYSVLNDTPGVLADRSYLPAADMVSALRDAGQPLFAVESKRGVAAFDVMCLPVHYELGALNCLELMALSGIPLTWEERDAADAAAGHADHWSVAAGSVPLVIAGGTTLTSNPEPYADFLDAVLLGDGEDVLPAVAKTVAACLASPTPVSREGVLLALAQVPGVYVPRFYEVYTSTGAVRPVRSDVPARPARQVATPQPRRALALVPAMGTVHDRLVVEVRRGCTRGCRFCAPGMLTRPARDVAPADVAAAVREGVKKTGYNEFSLLSLSCSDYLSLPAVGLGLKNELRDMNIGLSLPSQRVDRFDTNIAALSGGLRKSGLTFAVEAGTQRLRDVVNKALTHQQLEAGVRTAVEAGWHQVKLYFMMGLPSETDEDVLAIAETVHALQRAVRPPNRRRLSVHVTVSALIPKPHTPFQWHNVSSQELGRKRELLRKSFSRMRDVKVNISSWRIHSLEDFLSRGDRRASAVILRARELGVGPDAWWTDEKGAHATWEQAIADCGLSPQYRAMEAGSWDVMNPDIMPQEAVRGKRGWYDYAKRRGVDFKTLAPRAGVADDAMPPPADEAAIDASPNAAVSARAATAEKAGAAAQSDGSLLDRALPWDHIDTGVDKGWLRDELMRALSGSLTPDCSFSSCSECGVCGSERGNNVVLEPPPIPAYAGDWRPDTTKATTLRLTLAKLGDASLLSHLDTFRLFDRAFRRARLPISYSAGFHPKPRVSAASALPFGATADAELFDLSFTEQITAEAFTDAFAPQLPSGFHVVDVAELSASAAPLSHRLRAAEYLIGVYLADESREGIAATAVAHETGADGDVGEAAGMAATQSPVAAATTKVLVDTCADSPTAAVAAGGGGVPPRLRAEEVDWPALVAATLALDTCTVTRSTNGGKGDSTRSVDLRSRLFDLRVATPAEAAPVLDHVGVRDWPSGATVLAATTLNSNVGALSPDDTVELLRVAAAGAAPGLELLHAHRRGLVLASEEEVAASAAAAKAAARAVRKERQAAVEAAAAARADPRARGAAAVAASRSAAAAAVAAAKQEEGVARAGGGAGEEVAGAAE